VRRVQVAQEADLGRMVGRLAQSVEEQIEM
jgi:hypothetical protein